ncbi:MAG TPA: hypothetical protein VHG32_01300 [Thermoanaerobaculia bacterium]|jgi:hypothetical protein|nr:hypothetical protein [Thermoanaerobaculia bacterium]
MWQLVKAGLRIHRPVLTNAWTGSVLGVAGLFAVLYLVGIVDSRHALSWAAQALPVYLLYASAVVGWIIIGTELSEHRLRLHALLPLPLSRVALAQLVLPATMLVLGLPLAHAAAAIDQAVFGAGSLWLGHVVLDLMAAHLLLLLQLTLAVKEVTVLRESGWAKAALGILFVVLVVLADLVVGLPRARVVLAPGVEISVHIGSLAVCTAAAAALAALTAAFTVTLFVRRIHVTR